MEDNIFKRLRLEHTRKTVMQGEGKTIPVIKPLTATELSKKMHMGQNTVSYAEKGVIKSLSTYIAYHDYFKVPYSTLFGETETMNINNLAINNELGLSDDSIKTIKKLSPTSRSMLNVLLSKQQDTDLFLSDFAELIFCMYTYLNNSETMKSDTEYQELKRLTLNRFEKYMKTISFKDLKQLLISLDEYNQTISEIDYSEEELLKMDEFFSKLQQENYENMPNGQRN